MGVSAACNGESEATDEAAQEARGAEVEVFDPELTKALPPEVPAEKAERGREQFVVCATCHGSDARGTALGPSLRDQEWLGIGGTFEEIKQVIRAGVPEPKEFPVPMPAGGGGNFTEDEVEGLAAYVYALSHAPAQ